MKGQTMEEMEDVLKIIEKQQIQIEQLEKQVSCLLSRDTNGNDSDSKIINGVVGEKNTQNDNGNHSKSEVKGSEDRGGMSLENRVLEMEDVVLEMKGDMLELMMVYQDIQDKLYDIDRSWQNSLVFHNVKQDSASVCSYESSECTEVRLRDLLRSALNIRRDIQFMRVLRIYNGPDTRSGNRPIVACFTKWSDKEEVLRKKQLLKTKGITVEEDLSRAARLRRRELEKLMKLIKTREPERRCFLTYDRLVVDDNVYIFNDLEARVERLPNKVVLSASNMDLSDLRDSYTPTCQSFRSSHTSIRKGLSTDSLLDRIPPADTAGPRISSGVRKSLDNLSRASNTQEEQRSDSRPSSRRRRAGASHPVSRAASSDRKT